MSCRNIRNCSHSNLNNINCPRCDNRFISGYTENGVKECPECGTNFVPANLNGTNNIHSADNCPGLMSDGRFLTNYNSSSELMGAMASINGFDDSNEFRKFVQANGINFINAERKYLYSNNSCNPTISCSQGWDQFKQNNSTWKFKN